MSVLIFMEVSDVNVTMDMILMKMEHLAMVCMSIINHKQVSYILTCT